ncbi:MAG: nucleoside monophosphate kinase [Pirellulales bacterium]|nr:nucleoside monophosphate kinase [Pirellulales bacterium]
MENATEEAVARHRAIVLLGPTGSGKTPLGETMQRRGLWGRQCLHFDFGANLREIVRRNCPSRQVTREDIEFLREVLESGALLENEHFPVAGRILQSFLAAAGAEQRTCIVLNGLPRHVGQARAIETLLHVDAVIDLQCSGETVLARIRSDIGGDRVGRIDDDLDAIRTKLAIFRQRTAPLLEHYRGQAARIETLEVTDAMTPQQAWQALNAR